MKMSAGVASSLLQLKEDGNVAFSAANYEEALSCYTQAINLYDNDESLVKNSTINEMLPVLYKNRAAVYLKLGDFNQVVTDCTHVLQTCPNDVKALFRRAQAYEGLDKFEMAYQDAKDVLKFDKNNRAIQPILVRLHTAVSQKMDSLAQINNKVKRMMEIVFENFKVEGSKRETAADNLVYLAKDRSSSQVLYESGVLAKFVQLLRNETNVKIRLSAIRCVGELSKHSMERAKAIVKECGVTFFLDALNSHDEEVVYAASYIIQVILDSISARYIQIECNERKKDLRNLSGADRKAIMKEEERRQNIIKENDKELSSIMKVVGYTITSRTITAESRDALLSLITKNCKYDELNWAEKMLKTDTYLRLMEIASELNDDVYKHESAMEITDSTRHKVGCALAIMYEQMYDDKRRAAFSDQIDKFIQEKLVDAGMESKVRVIVAITTLLQNAPELGSSQISKEGILQMMLAMAKSEEYHQQLVAAEALIAATQKKKDSNFIIKQGTDILKQLYRAQSDHIKVRALVGLCKLGASSGHDASLRPFADGSSTKLAEACRRFLVNPGKDRDLRKWAIEGLSYLSLDADVKEHLIEDESAIKSLVDLAQSGKQDCAYGVITLLVNCTNSFEKQEILPEMLELAKFAKHHIPQEHELDDPDFVDKRIWTLAHLGVPSALVALSKTQSNNLQELISRVMNAFCRQDELRGLVVQQGGSRALVPLALEGTTNGMRQAAQALARIGISQDPAIAFPGQRSVDIIRPICALLNSENSGIENFEALMCLGNLASLNETTRARILNESKFICAIESLMYEEHTLIRRAAVQCWTNLCASPIQIQRCEGKNDRVKYCVLLCGDDEDAHVAKAAGGALAMLTSGSKTICKKVFDSIQWNECLLSLLASTDYENVLRACVVIRNMVFSDSQVATKVLETQIMDALQAYIFRAQLDEGSYKPDENLVQIRALADEILAKGHELKIIKTSLEAQQSHLAEEENV